MDNWVDYFIINEFAMNYDAGNLSTYLYKELGTESCNLLYGILTMDLIIISGFIQKQIIFIQWKIHGLTGCGRTKILENMSVKDMCSCVKPHYLMNILLTK